MGRLTSHEWGQILPNIAHFGKVFSGKNETHGWPFNMLETFVSWRMFFRTTLWFSKYQEKTMKHLTNICIYIYILAGFNPIEKHSSTWESSPRFRVPIKNVFPCVFVVIGTNKNLVQFWILDPFASNPKKKTRYGFVNPAISVSRCWFFFLCTDLQKTKMS